jgi:hypothetical protein
MTMTAIAIDKLGAAFASVCDQTAAHGSAREARALTTGRMQAVTESDYLTIYARLYDLRLFITGRRFVAFCDSISNAGTFLPEFCLCTCKPRCLRRAQPTGG